MNTGGQNMGETGEQPDFDFKKPQGPGSSKTIDIQPAWKKAQYGAKTPDATYGLEASSPSANQPSTEAQYIADTSQTSDQQPRADLRSTESTGPVYDVDAKFAARNKSTLSENTTGGFGRSKHLQEAARRQAQAAQAQELDWSQQIDGPILSNNVPNAESFRAADTQPTTAITNEMLEDETPTTADTQEAPKVEPQAPKGFWAKVRGK